MSPLELAVIIAIAIDLEPSSNNLEVVAEPVPDDVLCPVPFLGIQHINYAASVEKIYDFAFGFVTLGRVIFRPLLHILEGLVEDTKEDFFMDVEMSCLAFEENVDEVWEVLTDFVGVV